MIRAYIEQNYEMLQGISRTITKNRHPDHEDLLSEVILILLESDEEKINSLIQKKQIRYWIVRIMLNQYNSKTSPFHYKYRIHEARHRKAKDEIIFWYREKIEDKILQEQRIEAIEEALEDIEWMDQMITKVYYYDSHSLNTLARATGISRTTLYKAIKRTRHEIQDKIL